MYFLINVFRMFYEPDFGAGFRERVGGKMKEVLGQTHEEEKHNFIP